MRLVLRLLSVLFSPSGRAQRSGLSGFPGKIHLNPCIIQKKAVPLHPDLHECNFCTYAYSFVVTPEWAYVIFGEWQKY